MTIQEIEQQIIDRITSLVPDAHVAASPDDPAQWVIKGARGVILVRYQTGSYEPSPIYGRGSRRQLQYAIVFGARNLRPKGRAHQGVYAWIQSVRDGLFGWAIVDPDNPRGKEDPIRFTPGRDEFIREENGVWWYALTVVSEDMV